MTSMNHEYSASYIEKFQVLKQQALLTLEAVFMVCEKSSRREAKAQFFHLVQIYVEYP